MALCLQQSVRNEDVVCRYGGEEFVIILPEISEKLALERAEAIRRNVSSLNLKFKGEMLRPITMSIGLAMYPIPARNGADLLRMADRALYNAKRGGRDQTDVATESGLIYAGGALAEVATLSVSSKL